MDYSKKDLRVRFLEEGSIPAIPRTPAVASAPPGNLLPGYQAASSTDEDPSSDVAGRAREGRSRKPKRSLQVTTAVAAAISPEARAIAVPPPELPASQRMPIPPQAINSPSSEGDSSCSDWLPRLCVMGIAVAASYGIYYAVTHSDYYGPPVFSGIVPNGTDFNSSQSLSILPNATLSGAEGEMNLTGHAAFLPGYPATFCNLTMPGGDIYPFNQSLATAFNYAFPNASSLIDFAKAIYLRCEGTAASLRLTSAVCANNGYSPTLVSVVNFAGASMKNGLSFFKSMLRGGSEMGSHNTLSFSGNS